MSNTQVRTLFGQNSNVVVESLPREQVFRILWPDPKSRVLGLPDQRSDAEFWTLLGFETELKLADKMWTLRDTTGELGDAPVQIQLMYRKAEDIAAVLASPDSRGFAKANMGLVGKDTLEELYAIQNDPMRRINNRVTLDIEEGMNTDLSRGAITLLVREGDTSIRSINDLDGRDLFTKYEGLTKKFARRVAKQTNNTVQLGAIIPRKGGHEMEVELDEPGAPFLLSDFTQSGRSAARAGLRVLGDSQWDAAAILAETSRFDDRTLDEMKALPFTLDVSYGVLARPFQQAAPEQERIGAVISQRIFNLIQSMGRNPQMLKTKSDRPAPAVRTRAQMQPEIGHGHGAQRLNSGM